jgi:hypothetical protein
MTERRVINLAERKKQQDVKRSTEQQVPHIEEAAIPEYITPQDITKMTDAQLEQMLNVVRLRRMQATLIYENTQKEKERIKDERLFKSVEKASEQVFKKLERVNKYLDDLELKVNELRGYRLAAGLSF